MPVLRRQAIHVRIVRGGRLLADMGRPHALAPSSGPIRGPDGRVVGRFLLAVQDDRAYVMVLHRITGAEVLLRVGRHQVLGTLTPGPARIPQRGTVAYRGKRYEALSFDATAFPAGPLRISILADAAAADGCAATVDATIANTLGGVGRRIYEEEASSGAVSQMIRRIQASQPFVRAVARGDGAGALRSIRGFFRLHQFHIVRVRVLRQGRLLADLGGPYVLGPAQGVLHDRAGRQIATFLAAVQDDAGYLKLAQRFTGADVVMSAAGQVVMSTLPGAPATLPRHGRVELGGRHYHVYSFDATAFPTGSLRVSLLFGAR